MVEVERFAVDIVMVSVKVRVIKVHERGKTILQSLDLCDNGLAGLTIRTIQSI